MPALGLDFPLARYIDQAVLEPAATADQVRAAAERAAEYEFAALCVAPVMVQVIAPILSGTRVAVDTVVGFPLGFQTGAVKVFEAEEAVLQGAQELDLVLNRGWLRAGQDDFVGVEVRSVVEAVSPVPVKAILETSDLSREEVFRAAEVVAEAGAEFVKTSTGFFGPGADLETVRALRARLGERIKIKAAGGIRDLDAAWAFIQAGAQRLGASAGEEIVEEFLARYGK